MDFDSLRTSLDNCEARYIRRTVGNALNECLAELLCVRPTDPIEYMGHWLHHYAERRSYFKKKKSFYESLLATKIDMDNRRLSLIQKHNEAIIDITKPLLQPKSVVAAKELSSAAASATETVSIAQKSTSEVSKLTTTENMLSHDSDISDNSSLTRSLQCGSAFPISTSNISGLLSRSSDSSLYPQGSLRLALSDRGPSRSRAEMVVKRMQEIKATSDRTRQWKAGRSKHTLQTAALEVAKRMRNKKKSSDIEPEDDVESNASSSAEILVNTRYFDKGHRHMSIEPVKARWKVFGNQVVCYHPVLGSISIQMTRPKTVTPIETVVDFKAESMYDHELYSFDLDAIEINVPDLNLSESEGYDEAEAKSTSDIGDVGFFD